MITFSSLSLREELTHAVTEMGFENPTPIQAKVIPHLLSEPSDIIGLAQTGTGKTAAFGLPLLHRVEVENKTVQALVLSPTRELCMQIQEEFKKYSRYMHGLKTVAVYGGVPIGGQIRELKYNPQVVVATPGRLIDLLERKALSLEDVQYVVLDEADEMLNMGFRDDIDFILKNTISRQYTWLFSATMNNEVRGIAKRFMKEWKEYSVTVANTTNENIDHQYYVTYRHLRFETLQRLLDFTPGIYGIIFVRTKQDCQDIAEKLMKQGYQVSPLHGDMDQKMRSKVMERFKNKSLQAIVATDVAARGIDVNDITHVINYELPDDPEVYTHRSGRTARAGKSGICISIVTPKEISTIRQIERLVKKRFHKSDIPDGAEVVRKRLFYQLEQIETAQPEKNFAEVYLHSIHDRFNNMEKDELIKRLIWLQLKDTIENYHDASDLNAGYDSDTGDSSSKTIRLFMNLGTKDGIDSQDKLIRFITESTDIDPNIISRVTVREMASFFNVRSDAAEFIKETLAAKKHKGRKIRLDEAEQKPRENRDNYNNSGKTRQGDRSSRNYGNDRNKPRYSDRERSSRSFPERKNRS